MSTDSLPAQTTPDLQSAICRHAIYSLGRPWRNLSLNDRFTAVALTVRDRMIERYLETEDEYRRNECKRLHYLSIEYLIGQSLGANLRNLGIYDSCRQALKILGTDLCALEEIEPDAALGNGGLGRLAACFLDSLATMGLPGCGYGINYEFGLFKQEIENGYQREVPDNWLALGTPWQIARPDEACIIPIYGHIEHALDRHGSYNPMWLDWQLIIGLPYDMLIPGFRGRHVNVLRLFSARPSHEFNIRIFNDGDYFKAVEQKIQSEVISKVLYPSDSVVAGKELRLAQEYFLVACAIRDIVRQFERNVTDFRQFPSMVAIQLNDTHPALAVAELMRLLVDEKELSWENAWAITQQTFGYTNHTLSSEALEKWPIDLLNRVLPRHLQIIREIDCRFREVIAAKYPDDPARITRMSIIEDSTPKQVRMVNLAIVGSHSVNGVSPIHTDLLRSQLLPDFHELWPEQFHNMTNGISPRRWLLHANPLLAELICSSIGDRWITDLYELRKLEPYAEDDRFQAAFRRVKRLNKERLNALVESNQRERLDPDSLFDVHVKRIHVYKRQLLKVMHIIHEYLELVDGSRVPRVPRTHILAGKAAPGYWLAKQIIKLIHNVADIVNNDGRARGILKVVFIPDYRVSLAEKIIPAADLSEQISTAGKEASGTGNMKMALNGAVLIGTHDGSNLEIKEEVGSENTFLFGLKTEEILDLRRCGEPRPRELCSRNPKLMKIVDALRSPEFCPPDPDFRAWIDRTLLGEHDEYMHIADLAAYLSTQDAAEEAFVDVGRWSRMSILSVARAGKFSSDRTISEYAHEIWRIRQHSAEPDLNLNSDRFRCDST